MIIVEKAMTGSGFPPIKIKHKLKTNKSQPQQESAFAFLYLKKKHKSYVELIMHLCISMSLNHKPVKWHIQIEIDWVYVYQAFIILNAVETFKIEIVRKQHY